MGSRVHNQKHRNGKPCVSPSPSSNKIFLPILCRLSIKDTTSSIAPQPTSRRANLCPDPRSPKVSCMGQVKRHPSSTTTHKIIKKCVVDQRRRRRRQLASKLSSDGDDNSKGGGLVNFAELDPPLPVIKKLQPLQPSVSLWKRRSSLPQLTDIQIPTFQTAIDPPPSI
ncbi:hypothetical protein DCAR_0519982 [Daucus carota subsp. sativus]|uniref:Uncharacterized protein n=1 Tax=Daucus carota subsp. sativus TaxID=79200 RepID=A0A175YC37_DAUCS|nr:hypothetical protein DCAR_0519982 [Daucus carota subsp. sativus]